MGASLPDATLGGKAAGQACTAVGSVCRHTLSGTGIEELEMGFSPVPVLLVAVATQGGAEGEEIVSPAHQAELS
jgi:hypothetical protein